MTKYTKGYALDALVQQLQSWKQCGEPSIYFGALTSHPETDEDCTFGDLISPALDELNELRGMVGLDPGKPVLPEVGCRYCGKPSEDRSGVCDHCDRKVERD